MALKKDYSKGVDNNYMRVPHKVTPYRKFTPFGPSVKQTRPAGMESSPGARGFSRKVPELRNKPENIFEGENMSEEDI